MAELTTSITEAVNINGTNRGNTISQTISGVLDVFERNVTVPTSEVTLYTTHASVPAGSVLDKDLVKYARITNLDVTNFIDLRITNENNDEFVYRVYAGQSFVLHSHVGSMNGTENAAAGLPNGDIVSVEAQANTAACSVEVFVCSA